MNIKLTTLIAVVATLLIVPAFAENTINQAPVTTVSKEIRQEAAQNAEEIKQEFIDRSRDLRQEFQIQSNSIRDGLQNSLKAIQQNIDLSKDEAKEEALRARTEAREMIQTKAEEVKQEMMLNREEFRKQLEEGKEEARVAMEENRLMLQKRIKSLNDEKKKTAVTNFSEKISELNIKYTDHLTSVINNIEVVLQGIISRTEKASVDGKDVSSVRQAIVKAEEKIAEARSKIIKQSAMTYAVDGGFTEGNLKTEASLVREALRNDLQATKDAVLIARRSVSDAAVALGHIQGINNLEIEQ